MSAKRKVSRKGSSTLFMLGIFATLVIMLLHVLVSISPSVSPQSSHVNQDIKTKEAVNTIITTVQVDVDPFFTSTPRRKRDCHSTTLLNKQQQGHKHQHKQTTKWKMKLLFIEEKTKTNELLDLSTHSHTHTRARSVKFNLIQSLKRNHYKQDDFEFLEVPHNSSFHEKVSAIANFLKSWNEKHLYTHVLLSTSTHVLFGSSPQQLITKLDGDDNLHAQNMIFAQSSDQNEISIHPLFAYGKITYLQNVLGYFQSKTDGTVSTDTHSYHINDSMAGQILNSIYKKKKQFWKLHLDNSRSIIAHTCTMKTKEIPIHKPKHLRKSGVKEEKSPLWVVKTAESQKEQGGGGLGKGYCLVERKHQYDASGSSSGSGSGSGDCSHHHSQPDVLLFPSPSSSFSSSSASTLDDNGYNFLVSNYLSASPDTHPHKFSTFYKRKQFRLVASLTTLPQRLSKIDITLTSLVSQHVKPDIIYLNIPKVFTTRFQQKVADVSLLAHLKQTFHNKYGVPFVINSLDTDVGPLSKLLPTLLAENDPNTIIITVDDDMIFKPTLFGILLQRHLNNPTLAYAVSGQLIDIDHSSSTSRSASTTSDSNIDSSSSVHVRTAWKWKDGAYPVDILEGFTGAIYRRDFFDPAELERIPPECIFTDDIWISAHLARRGIPRVKLALGWGDTAEFTENDKIAPLREDNLNGTKRNDLCASLLLRDFQSSWLEKPEEYCSFEYMTI